MTIDYLLVSLITVNGKLINYSAILTSGHSKRFIILPSIHPLMHTFTHRRRCQLCKATASSLGAVKVRCIAQGHLDTIARGSPGFELATLRSPVNPLYLLRCIKQIAISVSTNGEQLHSLCLGTAKALTSVHPCRQKFC